MNDIPADLPYSQNEFERFLDETSAPLSDDEMVEMSAYFQSENFQHEENNLFDIIEIDKQKKEDTNALR